MKSEIEKLLAPVSAEHECGEDVSGTASYQELEQLILGKPETQFSAAESPDWNGIRDRSAELLGRSKHLRLVIVLAAALVRVEGLSGLRDGLALLKTLAEKFWQNLYPRLDPEDNNDPMERINIIAAFAAPQGIFGDPFKFLEGIKSVPLTDSKQYGRLSLQDIANSRAGVKSTKEKPVPAAGDIEAAFRDTNPAAIQSAEATAAEALALTKGLQKLLDDLVGSSNAVDFGPLAAVLGEARKQLAGYLPKGAAVGDGAKEEQPGEAAPVSGETGAGPTRSGLTGTVENRQQVVQALDLVCNYYARLEPSSPVPLLVQRARRLVELDFLGVVADLSPEMLDKVKAAAGVQK